MELRELSNEELISYFESAYGNYRYELDREDSDWDRLERKAKTLKNLRNEIMRRMEGARE